MGLSLCARAQIRDTLIVQQNDIIIELDGQGYHHVKYGDNHVMEAGAPELPIITKQYYIPNDAADIQLTATILNEQQLDGVYNVYPSQGLIPITQEKRPFVELSDTWSDSIYPPTVADILSDSRIFGYRIVTICYHPFAYNVGSGALITRNVGISLSYTVSSDGSSETLQSSYRKNKCKEYVKSLVENPDLLDETTAEESVSTYTREVPIRLFAEGRPIPDFIIITNEELKPAFRQLAEWKTRRGIYTVIETTEYIDSVCSGVDLCEKIRNYIQEKEDCWGEGLAILLGGGIDIIPARTFMGMYGYEVSDMYYIDNNNLLPNSHNKFYKISLNSTIGRFPVSSIEEAKLLVTKTLMYEWAEEYTVDFSYVNNALITSSYLEVDDEFYKFNGGHMYECYNYVTNTANKKHWFLFDYFNQSGQRQLGNTSYELTNTKTGIDGQGEELSRESLLSSLSDGNDSIGHFHFIYHADHSGPFSMGASQLIKGNNITVEDVMQLNNKTGYYQVILSGGCHPADFSTSCIAKSFLMKPMRSAVAFMGNTDIGWDSEHFALDIFYKTMYGDIKWDWDTQLDNVWKSYVIDARYGAPKSRFHILGDPTLAFWTQEPQKFQNNYRFNGDSITITRPEGLSGKGSTICIYKEDEIYLIDTLYARREATFHLRDVKSSGHIYITTTGIGQSPQRDSIYLDMKEENLLEIDKVELIQNDENVQNGILSPGETFRLNVTYRALKNNVPSNVILRIDPIEDNLYVERLSSNSILGKNLQQGDTCQCSFWFRVKNGVPNLNKHNKNELEFNLYYFNEVYNYLGKYSVNVIRPELYLYLVETDTITKNLFDVKICLCVNGTTPFIGEKATLSFANDSVIVEDSVKNLTMILNQGVICELNFRVNQLSSEAVNNVTCVLNVHDIYGNAYNYTINPFTERPHPPFYQNVTFHAGDEYIDIVGDFSQVNCITTGEIFQFSETNSVNNFFRHQDLSPMTTYQYRFKRKVNGVESHESTIRSCGTNVGIFENFPNIVEHSSAFRGPINTWDVDCDGKQEIFAATWDYLENDGSLIAVRPSGEDMFNDKDNHIIESFVPVQGNYMSGVAIGELFDDGEQYVVSVTYNDNLNTINSVYCHRTIDNDGDGLPDLYWKKDTTLINSPCSPIIADLDDDDICEVIVPSRGNIIIFEANGEIRKIIANLDNSYKQPSVANVIPNSIGKQIIIPSGTNLEIFDSNGNKQNCYCMNFSNTVSSAIICDYDNDGYKESIVGELAEKGENVIDSIYIYAVKYKETGVSKEKLFGYSRHLSGRMDAAFAVGNLNANKQLEIITISESPNETLVDSLIKFDGVSNKRTSVRLYTNKADTPSIILAEINGDSEMDIIVSCGDSYSYLISNSYNSSITRTLMGDMHSTVNEGLIVSDIDKDGFTEIVCGTLSGRLYIGRTKGNPEKIEWGYYRANPQNTGEYGKILYPRLVNNEIYSAPCVIEQDLYIMGDVTISDTVSFTPHRKIVVWKNGVLNIDGATLNNARIVVKPGGKVNIINGAVINLRDDKSFIVPKDAQLRITNGRIIS